MRTGLLPVLSVAVLCVPAARQQPPIAIDPAAVAFGYIDATGSKLLTLARMKDNLSIDAAAAVTMTTAVCSEGREFPIRYVQLQKGSAASNGRQRAANFANDEGQLFEIAQGRAEPDDTCLLVPAGYLRSFPVSRNEFPKAERDARHSGYYQRYIEADAKKQPLDLSAFHAVTDFAKLSLIGIEKEKGRAAKVYWLLHRAGTSHTSQEVAVVEFNPVGDSLLGSLVLAESSRLSFFDMPASLKKGRQDGGCWRVDDDCVFELTGTAVPAVLGGPGRQVVFFTTQGSEGLLIVLLQAKDGKLVEIGRAYRYQAAI